MFSQDFKEFVELLIKYKTEYLIVGGYAVGIHGHPEEVRIQALRMGANLVQYAFIQ